jgi:hypothetical protein
MVKRNTVGNPLDQPRIVPTLHRVHADTRIVANSVRYQEWVAVKWPGVELTREERRQWLVERLKEVSLRF